MNLPFCHTDEGIPQRMSVLVTMLLFPAENLNIQGWSLQIFLMSLHLLTNLLFCGGGTCHCLPWDSLQGMLSLFASIACNAFLLVLLLQAGSLGQRRGPKEFSGWSKMASRTGKNTPEMELNEYFFFLSVANKHLCSRRGRETSKNQSREVPWACVCCKRGFPPLSSTVSLWSVLWSKVCVWSQIASRSARSTVVKPSSRWPGARALWRRGGRSF